MYAFTQLQDDDGVHVDKRAKSSQQDEPAHSSQQEEPAQSSQQEPAREEPAREEPAQQEPAREEPAREEPAQETVESLRAIIGDQDLHIRFLLSMLNSKTGTSYRAHIKKTAAETGAEVWRVAMQRVSANGL